MSRLSAFLPLLLAVGGGTLYHVAAKSIPKSLDPALALIVAYATALVASALAYLVLPAQAPPPAGAADTARLWHPAVLIVGGGAFLIEMGYLLAYRAGWPVSLASVLTNGVVALLLFPLGAVAFGESVTIVNGLGVLLCLAGLSLLRSS